MALKQDQSRIVLYISIAVLLSFSIFSAISYILLADTFTDRINRENAEHTSDLASQVSTYVTNVYNLAQETALSSEVTSMDPEKQKKFLKNIVNRYPFIDNLYVQTTYDGWQIARAKGENGNRSQRWWFQQMLTDNSAFVSKAFLTFGTEEMAHYPITSIYFPIYKDNEYVGILATNLKLENLQEFIEAFNDVGRQLYVLDSEGTVIAHPDSVQVKEMYNYRTAKKTLVARDIAGNAIIENGNQKLEEQDITLPDRLRDITYRALQGESGSDEYNDTEGTSFLCYYSPINLPGASNHWVAVTIQNKEVAMAPIKKFFFTTVIVALIIVISLIVLIQKRTKELQFVNHELLHSNRELEKARHEVIASNQQLQEINTSLEEEINERMTMEEQLSKANQEIVLMNEEIVAANESLNDTNQSLLQEIQIRQETEEALLFREKQYRAITSLIIQNPDDQEKLLCTILNDALLMLQATTGMIATVNEGSNTVTVAYVQGRIYNKSEQIGLDQGMFGIVHSSQKMLYVEDYRIFAHRINQKRFDCLTSVVMLPLKCQDRVIGMFEVSWLDSPHLIKRDSLKALQNFADLASVALENARTRIQIMQIAYQDVLTGLPNRASFKLRLDEEMDKARREGNNGFLMFIDIDDLKTINDTYGHACGDNVICTAAKYISESSGDGVFVARLGGDEFVLLKTGDFSCAQIGQLADHILTALSRDYEVGEAHFHLSSSLGIAIYPKDGIYADEILKNADNAMYAAKKGGKNCWRFYEAKMQTDTYERMVMNNHLRHAIEKGELSLHYQPQVDTKRKVIVGLEALVRWNSPEHGNVPPSQFIPLAEKSGLIEPIGKWVLKEAWRFARKLAGLGLENYRISVNVSPRQLADVDFESIIRETIAEANIQPGQLQIEITESGLLGCVEESIQKLLRIRALGVSISLDDFGTGFSSLTYLRQLPVSEIKIDKTFIDSLLKSSEKETLVCSVINMAHALNLKVVAEGVEVREQWDYLDECHCDIIQGYLFSRPLPESEILEKLQNNAFGS